MSDPLLNLHKVAARLGVSHRTVQRMIRRGQLTTWRTVSGYHRIRASVVDAIAATVAVDVPPVVDAVEAPPVADAVPDLPVADDAPPAEPLDYLGHTSAPIRDAFVRQGLPRRPLFDRRVVSR